MESFADRSAELVANRKRKFAREAREKHLLLLREWGTFAAAIIAALASVIALFR